MEKAKTIVKGIQRLSATYLEQSMKMTPSQISTFLEDYQKVYFSNDGKRKPISLRVPEKLLEIFKAKAKMQGRPYQALIVELMRRSI